MLLSSIIFSFLLLLSAFTSLPRQSQQPIPNVSSESVAIQFIPAQSLSECQVKTLAQRISGFDVRRVSELETKGIVLLDKMPGIKEETARKSFVEFLKIHKNWVEIPVLKKGNIERIPLNNLVVKFKTGLRQAEIHEVFVKRKFEILESPSKYSPDRYVVRLPSTSAGKVLEISRELGALPIVQYVEPIYIILMKHR